MPTFRSRAPWTLLLFITFGVAGCNFWAEPDSSYHLERASQYDAAGQYNEAFIEVRNSLQKDPMNLEARVLAATLELKVGTASGATQEINRAIELGMPYDSVALLLARAKWAASDMHGILSMVPPDQMSHTEAAEWHFWRARASLRLGNRVEAEDDFQRALELDPSSAHARFGQMIMALLDNDSEALRRWGELVLRVDDRFWEVHSILGILERREGHIANALSQLDLAVSLADGRNPVDVFHRGTLRLESADLAGAQSDANTLRRSLPRFVGGHYLAGLVYVAEDELEAARNSLLEAVDANPMFAPAHLLLAAVMVDTDLLEQAAHHLNRYRTLASNDVKAQAVSVALGNKRADAHLSPGINGQIQASTEISAGAHSVSLPSATISSSHPVALSLIGSQGSALSELDPIEPIGASHRIGTPSAEVVRFEQELPSQAPLNLQSILSALESGRFDDALQMIETLLEDHPDSAELHNMKGAAYLGKGDTAAALEALGQSATLDPYYLPPARNIADILENSGHTAEALRAYRGIYSRFPENIDVALRLIQLEARAGNDRRVEGLVEETIARHPDALEPRILRARHYVFTDQGAQAIQILKPVEAEYGDDPRLLQLMGEASIQTGDHRVAERYFRKLIDRVDDHYLPHLMLAQSLLALEDYAAARAAVRDAIRSAPRAIEPAVISIRLEVQQGNHDAAEEAYLEANKSHPGEAVIYNEGALAALGAGDTKTAIQRFEEAYRLAPNPETLRNLAQLQLSEGNESTARGLLETWYERSGQNADEPLLLLLAELRMAAGDHTSGVALYHEVLQANPDNVLALNNLAWQLHETEPDRAVSLARRATELAPSSPQIHHTYARALRSAGQNQAAVDTLVKAAGLSEADAGYSLTLAEWYFEDGHPERAQSIAQRLTREGGPVEQEAARALLQRIAP